MWSRLVRQICHIWLITWNWDVSILMHVWQIFHSLRQSVWLIWSVWWPGKPGGSGKPGGPGKPRGSGWFGHSGHNLHNLHFAKFSVLSGASLVGFSVLLMCQLDTVNCANSSLMDAPGSSTSFKSPPVLYFWKAGGVQGYQVRHSCPCTLSYESHLKDFTPLWGGTWFPVWGIFSLLCLWDLAQKCIFSHFLVVFCLLLS